MDITEKHLEAVLPCSSPMRRAQFARALTHLLPAFGIDTAPRVRAFLAIVGHETGHLQHLEENLRYRADRLREVFPRYFSDDATAAAYAMQPERIANRVYADRMGNGDEASGDGWRYRGRGLIQLTGRDNYRLASRLLPVGPDFEATPDRAAEPGCAVEIAAAWWQHCGLNELCDALAGAQDEAAEFEAFRRIVRRVNGGYNGLAVRWTLYKRAKLYLA